MEHMHEDGTTHDHAVEPLDEAYQPTSVELLAAAADDVANSRIELVQLKATLAMQNRVIAALRQQLQEASK